MFYADKNGRKTGPFHKSSLMVHIHSWAGGVEGRPCLHVLRGGGVTVAGEEEKEGRDESKLSKLLLYGVTIYS